MGVTVSICLQRSAGKLNRVFKTHYVNNNVHKVHLHLLTRYFIYDSTHLNCKKWRNLIACGFDSTTIFNSEKSNFKQPLLQLGDTLRILCTLLLFDQIHFPKSEPCRAITCIQCTSKDKLEGYGRITC